MKSPQMWRCLALALVAIPLTLGCEKPADEVPTHSEALQAYSTERQELERLQNEQAAMEERFEAAKDKLRAIEAERKVVREEGYQRLVEIDPEQAREYLEERRTVDAEVAREVREGIAKLTAEQAEEIRRFQEEIAEQEERVKRVQATLVKAEAVRRE